MGDLGDSYRVGKSGEGLQQVPVPGVRSGQRGGGQIGAQQEASGMKKIVQHEESFQKEENYPK